MFKHQKVRFIKVVLCTKSHQLHEYNADYPSKRQFANVHIQYPTSSIITQVTVPN